MNYRICNIFWVGEDVMYNGKKYHVQDTNALTGCAKIGVPDANGVVWDTVWVPFEELSKIKEQTSN